MLSQVFCMRFGNLVFFGVSDRTGRFDVGWLTGTL